MSEYRDRRSSVNRFRGGGSPQARFYLPRSRIPLLSIAGYRFYVEEGLFWMLQENGWYFPYTAEWSWEEDEASLLSGEH